MTRANIKRLPLILSVFLITASGVHAEYYTFVDEQGNTHFTDNPSSIPSKGMKRISRVDVDMGPDKIAPQTTKSEAIEDEEPGERAFKPNVKRAKKVRKSPAGSAPSSSPIREPQPAPPQQSAAPTSFISDPALSTPLKTIRHFRRSLARADYTEAAKCLGITAEANEVQAFMSQAPKDFALKLSSEFAEAIEIYRDEDTAIYSIGGQGQGKNKILQRNDIQLHKYGPNWYISH